MARTILLIDIKEYLIALEEKVDFFHDIDDDTMDQMKEVVQAVKGNKDLLEKKVDYGDIVDNLESDDGDVPLSARQGKELKKLIDEKGGSGGVIEESDPTVPAWAKQPTKPTYTSSEVGADAAGLAAAVQNNLTTHKTDTSVHLQSGEREKWNAIKSVASVVQTVKGSGSDAANVWTMTFSDGSTSTFTVKNGSQGERGLQGIQGVQGVPGEKGEKGDTGAKGEKGDTGGKGEKGDPFSVSKTYASVSAMNAGYATDGLTVGSFVLIDTGNVDDEENARLYVKGNSAYTYVTDLSGAQGIKGDKGDKGEKGDKGDTGDQGPQGIRGIQGEQGIQGIQGPAGSDGNPGERGTGILNVTTAPSSYTTATGGFTPNYRIALSTVTAQSAVSDVLVGDLLAYSYYLYPVGYVDASYVYLGARTSIRGATGAAGAAGADYVLTDADKSEIAGLVLAGLNSETWTFTLEDGSTVVKEVALK